MKASREIGRTYLRVHTQKGMSARRVVRVIPLSNEVYKGSSFINKGGNAKPRSLYGLGVFCFHFK